MPVRIVGGRWGAAGTKRDVRTMSCLVVFFTFSENKYHGILD